MRLRVAFRLGWSYVAVVLLVAFSWLVAGVATSSIHDDLHKVVTRQDALLANLNAITEAMQDQESGLRGYLLTNASPFLEPYTTGRGELPPAIRAAMGEVTDPRESTLMGVMVQHAHAWQRWADNELRYWRLHRNGHSGLDPVQGKRLFDRFREASVAVTTLVRTHRIQALHNDDQMYRRSMELMAAIILSAMGITVLLATRNVQLMAREQHTRRMAEQAGDALQASMERYRRLLEVSPDAIVVAEAQGRVLMANRQAAVLLGYDSAKELVGLSATEWFESEERTRVATQLAALSGEHKVERFEVTMFRRDGTIFLAEISATDVTEGVYHSYIAVLRDITERKATEAELRHRALHDGLTGLPNRLLLQDRLTQAIVNARRNHIPSAVMIMDLNGFKGVNDTLGHHAGDELLQVVAQRLSHALRESDTVARWGGDEFAVLLPGANESGAVATAEKIGNIVREPIVLAAGRAEVSASIGIAAAPNDGLDAETLLRRADEEMYAAKRRFRGEAETDSRLA